MNLLKADFYHLLKDKVFYVLLAITFLLPFATCLMSPDMAVDKAIFHSIDTTFICSIVGIMIALFVGKDYANNTIRNKICYGEKRYKIMSVAFIESAIICLIFFVVSFVSAFIFGSIFGEFTFAAGFVPKILCQIAILLAFSTVVAAITICSKSVKIGLIVTLMISILLSSLSQMLPMLAVTNEIAAFFCRIIYATVSGNMLNSVNGTYIYTSYTQSGAASITFCHLYLNSMILVVVYILIAVGLTAIVVKKQSYK